MTATLETFETEREREREEKERERGKGERNPLRSAGAKVSCVSTRIYLKTFYHILFYDK